MFEKYTQQKTSVFMENETIKKLAKDNRWTISSNEKVPLDAKVLLRSGEIKWASILKKPYPLVTLNELNQDENLLGCNRTYRLNAKKNLTFMIDIEPSATDDVILSGINFPANYTEISMSGRGVHLLVEVPKDLVNDENRYLFEERSVIKDQSKTFEYLFNEHYITFTKRIATDKPIADFVNNQADREKLINLLAHIVESDKIAKANRVNIDGIDINIAENETPEQTTAREYLMSIPPTVKLIEQLSMLSPTDYNNDMSDYEWDVHVACCKRAITTMENVKLASPSPFLDKVGCMTEENFCSWAYELSKEILPWREKHEGIRRGDPWLVYQTKRAWAYVIAKQRDKKNNKKRKP